MKVHSESANTGGVYYQEGKRLRIRENIRWLKPEARTRIEENVLIHSARESTATICQKISCCYPMQCLRAVLEHCKPIIWVMATTKHNLVKWYLPLILVFRKVYDSIIKTNPHITFSLEFFRSIDYRKLFDKLS